MSLCAGAGKVDSVLAKAAPIVPVTANIRFVQRTVQIALVGEGRNVDCDIRALSATIRLDLGEFLERNASTDEDIMTRFSVPDMSCSHCKATVEAALAAVRDTGAVRVDLVNRTVEVEGTAALPALLSALDAAGYPASVAG